MIEVSGEDKTHIQGLKFIDLFAGIGGFHLALSSFDAKCLFASEWDKAAQDVYENNFGLRPFGDITKIDTEFIPSHDILCGGFPCQAFSISGKQKGFNDTRGTLFFDIARIIEFHKPKLVFLENVFNFEKHDNGNTLKTVMVTFEQLGYDLFYKVLNASNFNLPQNRERIYFVAFRKDLGVKSFSFPIPPQSSIRLSDIILPDRDTEAFCVKRNDVVFTKDPVVSQDIFGVHPNKPVRIGHVNKGGQGERIYHPNGHSIALSAYGGGAGAKTGLYLIGGKIRKLAPRECARVQGFPDYFIIHENKNQAYKQFGNSVAINVLQYILIEINKVLKYGQN